QDAIRTMFEDHRLQPFEHLSRHRAVWATADLEIDARLRDLEIAEERSAHPGVVVLAGVHQDLGMSRTEGATDGRGLDELRPRPDDGQHLHGSTSGGNPSPHLWHRPANAAPSTSRRAWPQGQTLPRRRAGLPAT